MCRNSDLPDALMEHFGVQARALAVDGILMLRIFHLLTKNFSLGEKPLSAIQIAHTLEIPIRLVHQLLHE